MVCPAQEFAAQYAIGKASARLVRLRRYTRRVRKLSVAMGDDRPSVCYVLAVGTALLLLRVVASSSSGLDLPKPMYSLMFWLSFFGYLSAHDSIYI